MMTLKEWYDSPDLVQQWRQTWEEPHMRAGLEVLLSHAFPKAPTQLPSGVDLIQFSALRGARDCGYFDFARNIEAIKHEPRKADPEVLDGWGDAQLDKPPVKQTPENK